MKAIVQDTYGAPEVLKIEQSPEPQLTPDGMLVEVHATSVTTADWRFRASAFPPGMWLVGRLVAGLFRPRHRLTGREFSGRVVAVGPEVSRFRVGDDIFGINPAGVNAERIVVPESAVVVKKPATLSHAEAAALPFGALTAISFLRDVAKIQPGERVLIAGASGGVGVYAVQMARALGAEVTAICSGKNADLVRELGAHEVVDYTREDASRLGRTWDVIIDPVGKTDFAGFRGSLSDGGRHVFIEAELPEIWQSIVTPWQRGPTVLFGVGTETVQGLEDLCELVARGEIRPVIGHRFVMDEIVEAHQVVEARRRRGAVIIDVVTPAAEDVEPEAAALLRSVG